MKDFLSAQRSAGWMDSEGTFRVDLSEATRKLAEFGQTDPFHWTLQFAQAMCALGCKHITVHNSSAHWYLEVSEGTSYPFRLSTRNALPEFNLGSVETPDDRLLLGICGLTTLGLTGAFWQASGFLLNLFGVPDDSVTAEENKGNGLLLLWPPGKAPHFPEGLWTERLLFYPGLVTFGKRSIRWAEGSEVLLAGHGLREPHWMEYLVALNRGQHFQTTGSGHPFYERKQDGTAGRAGGRSKGIRVRWHEEQISQLPSEQAIVYARGGLFGATRFHPVKHGCLLEPFLQPEYPEGFEIYFSADTLKADISQLSLLENEARLARLVEITPIVLKAVDIMFTTIGSSQLMAHARKTPLSADVAPTSLGVIAMGTLLMQGLTFAGLVLSTALACPVAAYFWLSRKNRRQEFEAVRDITLTALENKRAALRAFQKKYRVNPSQSVE